MSARRSRLDQALRWRRTKKRSKAFDIAAVGGRGEIRTHEGAKPPAGFQDRCLKPLGHPSLTTVNASDQTPDQLLLDGQQRMTSLYHVHATAGGRDYHAATETGVTLR